MAYPPTAHTGRVYMINDVPFTSDYAHSLNFESISDQLTYFTGSSDGITGVHDGSGKIDKVFTSQNYIKREEGYIRLDYQEEHARDWSYMMFKTPTVGDSGAAAGYEWIYCFINSIEHVSNSVLQINYTVDVLQTYALFNVKFGKCFIERRHTYGDAIGSHLEPEPVKSDDYLIINGSSPFWANDFSGWCVCVWMAYDLSEGETLPALGFVAGSYQGVRCFVFNTMDDFSDWLNSHSADYAALTSRIVAVVAMPSEFPGGNDRKLLSTGDSLWHDDVRIEKKLNWLDKDSTPAADKFIPNNNKLFTYPYNMLYITDGDKSNGEYAYEDFNESDISCLFHIDVAIQPNPEIMISPVGYKGLPNTRANYDHSLTMGDFPQLPWLSDPYKTYAAMKDTNRMLTAIGGAMLGGRSMLQNATPSAQPIQTPFGFMGVSSNMDPMPMLAGGVGGSITAEISQMMQETKGFPVTMHGNSASALCTANAKTFTAHQKCVRPNIGRCIDDFFTAFGYAINRVLDVKRTVNGENKGFSNGRKNQHYIKTVGCIIKEGDCPSAYMRQIEKIFDNGVTWWNPAHVGEYN